MNRIEATGLTKIPLGRQGENLARQIVFDVSAWEDEYGIGVAELIFQRSRSEAPYPVKTERDGNKVIWSVTASDTYTPGDNGKCELRYYVDKVLVKSCIWKVGVDRAMDTPSGTAPPYPERGWVDQVVAAGAEAKQAADRAENAVVHAPIIGDNGNWFVWDSTITEYIDTGRYSGGSAPYIGANGNWFIGTEDSGVSATGPAGPAGRDGVDGKDGAPGKDGISATHKWNGTALTITSASGTSSADLKGDKGDKGDKGEQGEQGIPGVAGSDAAVTAKNIQSALGYTPADSNDVSTKLDKPTTAPEVGKILKVTAVNEDGSFVCEWADAPSGGGAVDDVQVNGTSVVADGVANIPLAKMGSTGVVKFDAFMPFTFNADALRLANADENELTNPRYGFSTNRAITASNYRLAVELAMCDGKGAAWTDAEKTGAWKRLNSIKTTMDSVATPHTQYYLGNQTAVDIVLPDSSDVGQIIMVCWYNGATAATLSITGTMLAFDYTPSANTRSEINALWDGTYWAVLGNEMEVPSDAETT